MQERNVWHDLGDMHDCHAAQIGCDLFEESHPLTADGLLEIVKASDVSARAREVGHKSASNRIGHPSEDDGNGARRFQRCRNDRIGRHENDIRRQADDFLGHGAHTFLAFAGEPVVEANVAPVRPAELL